MKVVIAIEYDVDVSDLDPRFVDVEGFAEDEAYRIFEDDFVNGHLLPCDFSTAVVD
jgi:hypothetical protein